MGGERAAELPGPGAAAEVAGAEGRGVAEGLAGRSVQSRLRVGDARPVAPLLRLKNVAGNAPDVAGDPGVMSLLQLAPRYVMTILKP